MYFIVMIIFSSFATIGFNSGDNFDHVRNAKLIDLYGLAIFSVHKFSVGEYPIDGRKIKRKTWRL